MDNVKGNEIHETFQRNKRIAGYIKIWNGIREAIYTQGIIDKIENILMVIIAKKRSNNKTITIQKLTTNKCLSVW